MKIQSKITLLLLLSTFIVGCKTAKDLQKVECSIQTISYDIDTARIVGNLSKAVQIRTCSMIGDFIDNGQAFLDFHLFLQKSYPRIHQYAERYIINQYSLIYHFKGTKNNLSPCVWLAHQDVVPENFPEKWTFDPWAGTIRDGYVYGRGTLDMKSTLISLMEAMEFLLEKGFKPERDIYFCFGHDEEPPTTNGAKEIAKWFQKKNIIPAFIIDEGGVVLDGHLFGLEHTFALIATSEKGYVDIKVTVSNNGGHGSLPSYPTTIGQLSEVLQKIEQNPMKSRFTPALQQTIKEASPYLPKKYKWLAKNAKNLFPLVVGKLRKIPLVNALISTTATPTMLSASSTANTTPKEATAIINTRIIPGYTRNDVQEHMQKIAKDKAKVEFEGGTEPTIMASIETEYYQRLKNCISSIFPDSKAIPYMFIANTDSRYYQDICPNIYRFTPLMLTPSDQNLFHGIDERCSIQNLVKATNFFIQGFLTMTKE